MSSRSIPCLLFQWHRGFEAIFHSNCYVFRINYQFTIAHSSNPTILRLTSLFNTRVSRQFGNRSRTQFRRFTIANRTVIQRFQVFVRVHTSTITSMITSSTMSRKFNVELSYITSITRIVSNCNLFSTLVGTFFNSLRRLRNHQAGITSEGHCHQVTVMTVLICCWVGTSCVTVFRLTITQSTISSFFVCTNTGNYQRPMMTFTTQGDTTTTSMFFATLIRFTYHGTELDRFLRRLGYIDDGTTDFTGVLGFPFQFWGGRTCLLFSELTAVSL